MGNDVVLRVRKGYGCDATFFDVEGELAPEDRDALLAPCADDGPVPPGATLETRTFQSSGGVTVQAKFYWPPPPKGFSAGYTAPLLRWVETRIEGLTTAPIVLTGYFSQTYRPQHHNFTDDLLFEPGLEEGLPADVRAELEARGIRQIFVSGEPGNARMLSVNAAGELQDL